MSVDQELRERRRLKILARSEERLKKLTNSSWIHTEPSTASEIEADTSNVPVSTCFHHQKEPLINGITPDITLDGGSIVEPSPTQPQHHLLSHDVLKETFLPKLDELVRPPLSRAEDESSGGGSTRRLVEERTIRANDCKRLSDHATSSYITYRNLFMLALGVVVRLTFLCDFGKLYVQTIFNPFVAVEIAIVGYERAVGMECDSQVSAGVVSMMWLYMFQVLNFDRKLVCTYKRVLATAASVFEDFSSYFFSFIVTHIFLLLLV